MNTKIEWVEDAHGNKCSSAYFGSLEAAQAALDGLKNCKNCINCSGCSGCSDCSDCSGCSRCSRCSDCSDCSGCSRCSRCSGCSYVAFLCHKNDIRAVIAEGEAEAPLGQPPIPVIAGIHRRVYEAASAPKALNMGDWHTCNTTHCRGGWVVHLAGEAGYALERYHNTLLAAQLIYDASDPSQSFNPSRFFDGGDAALEDMKRLANAEAAR